MIVASDGTGEVACDPQRPCDMDSLEYLSGTPWLRHEYTTSYQCGLMTPAPPVLSMPFLANRIFASVTFALVEASDIVCERSHRKILLKLWKSCRIPKQTGRAMKKCSTLSKSRQVKPKISDDILIASHSNVFQRT